MSRIPVIGDTHFGIRADSAIVYAVQEQFFRDVFWPAIDAEGDVTDVLHLGDVTDRRRYINFQTLSFAKHMLFEPARERGITLHWVLGNHDLPYKHSMSLSTHEAFREYDNVRVYRESTVVPFQGVNTLLVPWLCEENIQDSLAAVQAFDGSVIAGHFEFVGFEMYRGIPNQHGMDIDLFKPFPLVMSGHYHHRSAKGTIHYLGAPYEMIWSDHGEDHGFHWWTPETHQLDFVPNPHHLFYKFVYNDTGQPGTYVNSLLSTIAAAGVAQRLVKIVVRGKTQLMWYDTFANAVLRVGAHDVQFVDDTAWSTDDTRANEDDAVAESDMDTLTMIHRYTEGLPWSNTQFQRDVTATLSELYHEATELSKVSARS